MTVEPSSPLQYSFISSPHSSGGTHPAPTRIIQQLIRNTAELLRLDDCVVALLDDTGANLLVLATARAESVDAQMVLPLCQEPLAGIARRREVLVLHNVGLDARLQPLTDAATRTLALQPLLAEEQWLGVLIASTSAQATFPPEQLRALALLGEQITLAIHNARQAELLRDASRMKTNFLSLVTHELRSPLNTINGYLDLLLEGIAGEINEQQQEFIRRARSSSEHLYALLEDLLLASRADAGQLRLNRAPASLRELVTGSIDELEVTALDSNVRLETDLAADLPIFLVDSVRLQQVLRNLLINALHFTPAGGCVTVGARVLPARQNEQREFIEVRVCDTGMGIAPEYHTHIFERFFQVPRSEGGRTGGQGLGLAIVKMIIELHGGQVWVESAPGKGSTFVFTLDASHQE
ncbi:MAG TPA: HAMP domain-containing sensor histidine kinase [Ktedonobacteraceae bacterium]|jgi:signal transduction histidine kinase